MTDALSELSYLTIEVYPEPVYPEPSCESPKKQSKISSFANLVEDEAELSKVKL